MAAVSPESNDSSRASDILWQELDEANPQIGESCLVCLETIDGVKLSHKSCSLVSCKPCLLAWLSDKETCPLCRRHLKKKTRRYMNETDLIVDIRETRQRRPQPRQYYAADCIASVRGILEAVFGHDAVPNFWDLVRDEEDDSMFLLETEGIRALTSLSVEELVHQQAGYALDEASIERIWIASRIFGATRFYMIQLPAFSELGFWVPILPTVHRLSSPNELFAIVEGRRRADPEFAQLLPQRSTIAQLPIPTNAFANHLRSAYLIYPDEPQTDIERVYNVAITEGMTHWALIDLEGVSNSATEANFPQYNRGIWAVPWPADRISAGYNEMTYPGLMATRRPTAWDRQYDEWHLRSYASSLAHGDNNSLNYQENALDFYGEVLQENPAYYWDFNDSDSEGGDEGEPDEYDEDEDEDEEE